jgi:hypothetical protein
MTVTVDEKDDFSTKNNTAGEWEATAKKSTRVTEPKPRMRKTMPHTAYIL